MILQGLGLIQIALGYDWKTTMVTLPELKRVREQIITIYEPQVHLDLFKLSSNLQQVRKSFEITGLTTTTSQKDVSLPSYKERDKNLEQLE